VPDTSLARLPIRTRGDKDNSKNDLEPREPKKTFTSSKDATGEASKREKQKIGECGGIELKEKRRCREMTSQKTKRLR
jgi:hypothetical protein